MAGDSPVRHYNSFTAFTLVVASMIGTGVLTSLGFQVAVLNQGFSILALWALGGVASLCGAMSYAELGSRFPGSGGEYRYLSDAFHPLLGFVAGWASFLVGFSAPIAASGLAFGSYIIHAMDLPDEVQSLPLSLPVLAGLIAASVLTLIHALSHSISGGFQIVFTGFKIAIIIGLIALGFSSPGTDISFLPTLNAWSEMMSPAFVISLYFVSYAYSGWNASAYIAGEIVNPEKNLPRSLISGTLLVMVLYMALNAIFLIAVPIPELSGQVDIGLIFTRKLLGHQAGDFMGIIIALLLISGMSSMIIAGSRVSQVMAEQYPKLQYLSKRNRFSIPVRALLVQWIIICFYLLTASFNQVILYIGFVLNLFAFLSVLGMVIMRYRLGPPTSGYRVRFFPWIPLVFLVFSLWLMIYGLIYQPLESLAGLGVCLLGAGVWFVVQKKDK